MDEADLEKSLKLAYPQDEDVEEKDKLTLKKFIAKLDYSDLQAITQDEKRDVAFFRKIKTVGDNKLDYLKSLDQAQVEKLKVQLEKQ